MYKPIQDEYIDLPADIKGFNNFLEMALPKSYKQNLNSKGQIKPIQYAHVQSLYNVTLDAKTFARTANTFYKVNSGINKVSLRNQTNFKGITIDFNEDLFGYIKITFLLFNKKGGCSYVPNLELKIKKPKYNSCLFKIILNKKLMQ